MLICNSVFHFPQSDIIGALILTGLFAVVVGGIEAAARNGRLGTETARKAVHVVGGLGCALFPFLVQSWITVAVLASLFAVVFYLGESRGMLRALSGVERKSRGALYFPVAIFVVFLFGNERLWLYFAALFTLVLADTAAAMAGIRFGRLRFRTETNGEKSLEGTLAFGLVGFFTVLVPMLLLSDFSVLTCVLTALLMALLLAGLEGLSVGGTDNLFVPLGVVFLILKIPTKPPLEIAFQIGSLVAIAFVFFLLNRKWHMLPVKTFVTFVLVSYSAWSLGSVEWMLPLLGGFVIYNVLCSVCVDQEHDFRNRLVLIPLLPALIILYWANARMTLDFWFAPFLATVTVVASLSVMTRFYVMPGNMPPTFTRLVLAWILPVVVCMGSWFVQGNAVLQAIPPLLLLNASAMGIYRLYCRGKFALLFGVPWGYVVAALAASAGLLYAAAETLGWIEPLQPFTWKGIFRE